MEVPVTDTDALEVKLPPVADTVRERYPFCIVWTPITVISCLAPLMGHIGICDSEGRIYDFQGTRKVGCDKMLFGNPVKYWDVSRDYVPSFYRRDGPAGLIDSAAVQREIAAYDAAIERVAAHFAREERYELYTNNCYTFVVTVLNAQPLTTKAFTRTRLAFGMGAHGRYVSCARFFRGHWQFLLFLGLIVAVIVVAVVLSVKLG